MKITTWNANSVRLREACLERIASEIAPDLLCLQEIKVADDLFPSAMFERLGYPHHYVHGQKNYHGVAFASKRPFASAGRRYWCGIEESRHAWVRFDDGLEVHNFYIPAGGDVPDRETNPKFAHKLDMMAAVADWLEESADADRKRVLVGDLNIAPSPRDVWSHQQLSKVVSHTPIEIAAFERMMEAGGFTDAIRAKLGEEAKLYSWWSYRARDWAKSDRGRRLDHILVSQALADNIEDAEIEREARGWEKPSDHAPVSARLVF